MNNRNPRCPAFSVRLSAFGGATRLAITCFLLIVALLAGAPSARAATLVVDGAVTYQTIDGLGVNANSLSWNNGELAPAVDMLADQMGTTMWRVVFDMEDWESVNDNADPGIFNWDYYNGVYANEKFRNLWGTLGYLNQKGISSGITLSLMGNVPDWMGGTTINTAAEDEWVEMVASLVFYARNTMHLSFTQFDPLNEPDWAHNEGPLVDAAQVTRLLHKLANKLDAIGLQDLKLVAPSTASLSAGINTYMPALLNDSVVMAKLYHFGLHNYADGINNASQVIRSSAYPDRNYYMTELPVPGDVISELFQGASGIAIWDGYDSVYPHAILNGQGTAPPNDAATAGPAPLAYDTTTRTYSPRKCFYGYQQIYKFVPTGSVRIAASPSGGNVVVIAFYHQPSGRVTIVGRNAGTGSVSYDTTLANLPAVSTLQYYQTSETNPLINFQKGDDITVTNRAFTFGIPAGSIVTLTGFVEGADTIPPAVSLVEPGNNAALGGTVTLTAAATDANGVAGVRFLLDGAALGAEITVPPYSRSWDTGTIANGSHTLSAVARDVSGNTAATPVITVTVDNPDVTPPTVSLSAPLPGATVSGTIALVATANDMNGVAGVRFLLDGLPLGAEITAPPYSLSLNTTTISDGPHTVAATARDASGNSATTATVSFTVANASGVLPITLVQKVANSTSSAQNLTATLPSPVTAGNLIVVSVSGWPNLPAATAVTDNLGNSYTIAGTVLVSQGAYSAIYYARNVNGGTAAVTVRTVSSGGQISMVVAEFAGADKTSPLDKTAGAVGSGTAPSSGNLTPAMAGELLIGSGTHNGNTVTTAGSGFSMIAVAMEDSNTHQPLAMEYQVVSGTQPIPATFTLAAAYPWTQNGVLFKPAQLPGPDTAPPVVSITTPQNGATVSQAVTLSVTATDNVGVTRVEYYLDNALLGAITSAPYVWTWNTLLTWNGSHTITARAFDAAGNMGQSAEVLVTVDNDLVAPVVDITAPANNVVVSGAVSVTANAVDGVGVTRVEFFVNNVLRATDTASPYSFTWNTASDPNGAYTLTARAYDAAGNSGMSEAIVVTVVNQVAAIALVQKGANTTSSAQSLATALPASVTAGNLIVVSVSGWPNLPTTNAVTDSLGNSYALAGTVLKSKGAYSAIYYARNVKGGTNTVTVRTVKTGGQISMAVAEFSGVATVSPLERATGAVGTGVTPSSGPMTPSMAGNLIIGSGTHNDTTVTTAGPGFTMIAVPTEDSDRHQPLAMEYQIGSGTLPVSATFSLGMSSAWTQNGAYSSISRGRPVPI